MTPIRANPIARLRKILAELTRRKVVRTTGAYLVAVWLTAQGVADLFPAFGLPDWSVRAFVLGGILATPLVALLAWRYDITPRGIVRDAGAPVVPPKHRRTPDDVTKWVLDHHDLTGTGYLSATWTGAGGTPQHERFCDPVVIGRDVRNDIELPDPRVSRRHVVLWAENGTWWARDLDSSNGTYVDGTRIDTALLPPSCRMQFDLEGPVVELAVESAEKTLISRGR